MTGSDGPVLCQKRARDVSSLRELDLERNLAIKQL